MFVVKFETIFGIFCLIFIRLSFVICNVFFNIRVEIWYFIEFCKMISCYGIFFIIFSFESTDFVFSLLFFIYIYEGLNRRFF